jgi:hypothetical protein
MRKVGICAVMFASIGLLVGPDSVVAQSGSGSGPGPQLRLVYNPETVETIRGEVVSVDTIDPKKRVMYGLRLTLKTDKEAIPVILAPGWVLKKLDVKIELKDKIQVKGSRVTLDGKPAIIAAEIKKGTEVLKLREENGFPVWASKRRP